VQGRICTHASTVMVDGSAGAVAGVVGVSAQ